MANHKFILNHKTHYEIYWGRLNAIVLPKESINDWASLINVHDQLEFHDNPEDPKSKRSISPIYKTVLYVGPANVDDVRFPYIIVSFR